MATAKTSLFPLPQTQVVERVYVQLEDGAIAVRTPDQLAALPADPDAIDTSAPAIAHPETR
jgi:hypothetical protein